MARKPTRTEEKPNEQDSQHGLPSDGAEYKGAEETPLEGAAAEREGAASREEETPPKDPNQAILEALSSISRTQVDIARALGSRTPAPPEKETDTFYGENFDKEVFENPSQAFRSVEDRIVSKVTEGLRKQYTQDQQQRDFWNDFYKRHPDLTNDRDLVDATMNSNLADLADMQADKAADRLADLTRQRILRYAGKQPGARKRPTAEGASPPSGKKEEEEPNKVVTLSDLIRARKEQRRKATKGSAA